MRNHLFHYVSILTAAGLIIGCFAPPLYGVTVQLSDLQLVSPSDPDNVITIEVAPDLGAPDTQQTMLTGTKGQQVDMGLSNRARRCVSSKKAVSLELLKPVQLLIEIITSRLQYFWPAFLR